MLHEAQVSTMESQGPLRRGLPEVGTHPEGSALLDDGWQLRQANVHGKVPGLPGERTEDTHGVSEAALHQAFVGKNHTAKGDKHLSAKMGCVGGVFRITQEA